MKNAFVLSVLLGCLTTSSTNAIEWVRIKQEGVTLEISGKVLTQSGDGGVLLQDREGVLWRLQADEILDRRSDQTPYEPFSAKQMADKLRRKFPGFRIHQTAHYLICYNTSPAYAQWCGALYERLHRAFYSYWGHRGVALHESETPLIAVVFDRREAYINYARPDLGDSVEAIIGYYNLGSNYVVMYDLTESSGKGPERGVGASAHINRLLRRPEAERMVATIIHEATHQLAFNGGLHQRFANIPSWLSEGLAAYFETPDLESSKGWRTIGGVNRYRLVQFHRYLKNRPADSLRSLLTDSQRFRHSRTALDAYAEAWALNYYLIRSRPKDYRKYMEVLAAKPPLAKETRQQRLLDFTNVFGEDLQKLDRDFVRSMENLARKQRLR